MKNSIFYIATVVILFSSFRGVAANEDDDLFPFLISYDGPENITNMSHLLDAPAGKHGFVRIENGRFVTDAGSIRFYGTNLTGAANFPEKKDAERLASRLARFGINCVRLHYFDADYGNALNEKEVGIFTDPTTQRRLDPSQLDRMDYLVAQLKKRGIYVNMNLHVARKLDERDGFTGIDERPHLDKGVDNFEPRMIELQKEYAKDLLTHINPYTKLAYRDDPCVGMVEINNENALIHQYHRKGIDNLPEPYIGELQSQWNNWLSKKYSRTKRWFGKNIENGNIAIIKSDDNVSLEEKKDFYQFLIDTEYNYWGGMYNYLKTELGVKSVVSGTQLTWSPPFVQNKLDYIDSHAYWAHPNPATGKTKNESMVNSLGAIKRLATQRILDKPYTVSEYNHPFPNQYGAEGQPMLAAYGALQGWDGVFEYSFNHRKNFDLGQNIYYFSINDRTDVLAHLQACAAIYLRRDVKESKNLIDAPVDYASYFEKLVSDKSIGTTIISAGFDGNLSLINRVGVSLHERNKPSVSAVEVPTSKVVESDTKELTWNREIENKGYFTVNTPNTKLFTGFPEGRKISFGEVELSVGNTRLGWATVSLVSQNANGFGKTKTPSRILVTATGLTENKGMKIKNLENNHIVVEDWGTAPVMVEGVPAIILLPSNPKKTKCYALDPEGNRKEEISVIAINGKTEITLKPAYKTIWYEIEIE